VCQSGSGAYFVAVAQSVFTNRMLQAVQTNAPSLNAAQVLTTGASDILHVFGGEDLAAALKAYIVEIKGVFVFALASSACAVLLSLVIPFKKLPGQ
jgi:hypothetical protein